jgi:hypothetical protein
MEEESYTGLNPWHEAVCINRGLIYLRCHYYYQGEEEWRRNFAGANPHRWYVMIATAAKERGWRMTRRGFFCPKCVKRLKRRRGGGSTA